MKKREKKRNKKGKEKLSKKNNSTGKRAKLKAEEFSELKSKIKRLEEVVAKRDQTIEELKGKLIESENQKKRKKRNAGSGAAKLLRAQRSNRVGLSQRDAWKRHGFLRDRYEYHLEQNEDKMVARHLAGQDLKEQFGEEAGYSAQQLEQILS